MQKRIARLDRTKAELAAVAAESSRAGRNGRARGGNMTTLLKLSLVAMLIAFMVTSVSPAKVSADPCVYGSPDYNLALCQQYGGVNSPYYSLYCVPGTTTYSAVLCNSYGGQTNQASLYCQVGTVNYNPTLCAQY